MHAIYLQAEISGPESRGTIGVWCARNRPEKLESKVYEEKLAMYSGFIMNACILPSPSTLTLTYPSLHCLTYSHVFLRYFHLSTFFWMFLEGKYIFNIYFVGPITNIIKYISPSGLYLFLQVQMPLTLANFKYLYCILIGWGRQLVSCHCA